MFEGKRNIRKMSIIETEEKHRRYQRREAGKGGFAFFGHGGGAYLQVSETTMPLLLMTALHCWPSPSG